MNYIGLLDCNNFFVSCERLFRPDLANKPVIVLSSNDGCAVARSNEVKEMGVPMGVPYFQVKKELEAADCAVFSSNFTLYRDISRRVMDTLKAEVSEAEQYSVDEAFFTISGSEMDVKAEIARLKALIQQEVGVPVSIGAAKTKTIAKYASEKEKRGTGLCVLTGTDWQDVTPDLQLAHIWGVGGKTAQKFSENGLRTVADLQHTATERLQTLFGVHAVRLQAELSEQSVYRLGDRANVKQQSVMSTRSFAKELTERSKLEEAVAYHVTQVAKELRQKELQTRAITVSLRTNRHGDWLLHGGSETHFLTLPSNDTRTLMQAAKALVEKIYDPEVPYKKAGVVVSGLEAEAGETASLFPGKSNDTVLMNTVDRLNNQFGAQAIQIGLVRKKDTIFSRSESRSPHYTTAWDQLPVVN